MTARPWWKPAPKPKVAPQGPPRDPVLADIYYDQYDNAYGSNMTFRTRGDLMAHVKEFAGQGGPTLTPHGSVVALGEDSKGTFTIRVSYGDRENKPRYHLFDDAALVAEVA